MDHDQNWRWPEKTWFRERLNAIKAREHEQQRRKSAEDGEKTDQGSTDVASAENKRLKVD